MGFMDRFYVTFFSHIFLFEFVFLGYGNYYDEKVLSKHILILENFDLGWADFLLKSRGFCRRLIMLCAKLVVYYYKKSLSKLIKGMFELNKA